MLVLNDPNQPTRHQAGRAGTIIDYIIISKNLINLTHGCWVGEDVGSDHLPVHAVLSFTTPCIPVTTKLIRPLKRCDWNTFSNCLSTAPAPNPAHLNTRITIDKHIKLIENNIIQALDTACPLTEAPQFPTQISNSTILLIKLKRKIRRKAHKNPWLKNLANQLQNRVTSKLAEEKTRSWEIATSNLNNRDGRKFWQHFQRLTGCKTKARCEPKLALPDGTISSDPKIVADLFAVHLSSAHQVHEGPSFNETLRQSFTQFVQTHHKTFQPEFQHRNHTTTLAHRPHRHI